MRGEGRERWEGGGGSQLENEADPDDSDDSDGPAGRPAALCIDGLELFGSLRTRPGLARRFVGDVWLVP